MKQCMILLAKGNTPKTFTEGWDYYYVLFPFFAMSFTFKNKVLAFF